MNRMLAGIDVGATGLKVSLIAEDGRTLFRAYREYQLSFPGPGLAVIDPMVWWESFCSCFRELAEKTLLRSITAMGISCTNAMVLLDKDRELLFPAIMQLDKRGGSLVAQIESELGGDTVFRSTGNRIAAGLFWGPTLKWLSVHEAEAFSRVRYLLNPATFLVMMLTGAYCMDHTRATATMLYNIHRHDWDETLYGYFRIPRDVLPPLLYANEIAGVTKACPQAGLPAGIPVTAGIMDSISATIGLNGGSETGVLIMGSVGRFCVTAPVLDPRFMGTLDYDGKRAMIMTPMTAGVAYRWVKGLFFEDKQSAEAYQEMELMAAGVAAGSEGLLFSPSLSGESCPNWNEYTRGTFLGLSVQHKRQHLIRAVMEGVGFALAQDLQILRSDLGLDAQSFIIGGGGAKSGLWVQILSDIFGVELQVPRELETETQGAALMAGAAAGMFTDLKGTARDWNGIKLSVTPRPEERKIYAALLPLFCRIYENNRIHYESLYNSQIF